MTNEKKTARHAAPKGPSTWTVVLAIIVVGSLAGALIWPWQNGVGMPQAKPAPATTPPATSGGTTNMTATVNPEFAKLKGRWLRPDGGYVLQIDSVDADGQLAAKYLNPRPIKVAKALAAVQAGTPTVFIELQDVGYPGSTYRLSYSKDHDKLEGEYFQAAMGQTFTVEFVRSE